LETGTCNIHRIAQYYQRNTWNFCATPFTVKE
jgi:hypothetical protein